jgi:tRNA/tmRNA/rRNA uracil-C5-methylase (TrmA/RlmC/RlmD family)
MSTFAHMFTAAVKAARHPPRQLLAGECQSATGHRCRLCHAVSLSYEQEAPLKQKALIEFWNRELPGIPLDPLVHSPRGRGYRTVTKRRAFRSRGRITIGLIDPSSVSGRLESFEALHCAIEPDDHALIFSAAREYLGTSHAEPLANRLLYIVIKGTASTFSIILHVRAITHDLVRAANGLSKILTRTCQGVAGVFVLEGDPTDDRIPRYYLGHQRRPPQRSFRKIFGNRNLTLKILGRPFSFSPLSFTQINQPVFEEILARVRTLLGLHRNRAFYDLYCGYAPFALSCADVVARVIGADGAPEAIASAVANARKQGVFHARFLHTDITPTSLRSILKGASPGDALLLDPPRNGTAPGVIEYIAAKRFSRIAHLFCNIDLLSSEIRRWTTEGYIAVRAIPFDMFPGTPEIEIMVLLEPGK